MSVEPPSGRKPIPPETEQAEIELGPKSVVGIGFELSTDQALADWPHGFITIVSKRTDADEQAAYEQVIQPELEAARAPSTRRHVTDTATLH